MSAVIASRLFLSLASTLSMRAFAASPAVVATRHHDIDFLNFVLADIGHEEAVCPPGTVVKGSAPRIAQAIGENFLTLGASGTRKGIAGWNSVLAAGAIGAERIDANETNARKLVIQNDVYRDAQQNGVGDSEEPVAGSGSGPAVAGNRLPYAAAVDALAASSAWP